MSFLSDVNPLIPTEKIFKKLRALTTFFGDEICDFDEPSIIVTNDSFG
jgi:hypothetical protein